MMMTHTAMRASSPGSTAVAAQVGASATDAGAPRGADFLATLAAALSIEVASTSSGQGGTPDGMLPEAEEQGDAIDALIAALSPIVPVAGGVNPAASASASELPEAAPAMTSAMPGAGARTSGPPAPQLNDLLREVLAAQPDAGTAGDSPQGSPTREPPVQLVQTLAGQLREVAPEFRLAGGTDLITTAPASALTSATLQTHGGSATLAGEQVLRTAVGSPRWAEELGSRLVMLTARGKQEGSLTLSPEHLGPLEVRISVNQNTAQVWFGAHHADTRAALAEALPRLREMFAEAGLSLGQAGVSQEAPRRQLPDVSAAAATGMGDADAAMSEPVQGETRSISSALLDLYA